jgi:hypothetical protein
MQSISNFSQTNDLQTLLSKPWKNLVKEINAVNKSWKLAIEMFGNHHFLAQSLKNLKLRLQVRLLRNYAPKFVFLVEDTETESEESLYSLKLAYPFSGYQDAAHLPIRVAQSVLSSQEISQFFPN